MKQIVNGRILTPQGWLENGSVLVEGNKILNVINTNLPVSGAEIVDAKGCDIVPGGIEMHVHGGGGRDFMEGTEEAFRVAVDAHLQYGTTAIYPTLSSSTVPMIEAALKTTEKLMAEPDSPIMGLHLEGPYFNMKMAGAQIPEWIKAPVKEEYEHILGLTSCLKRQDAAPELEGSIDFIKACKAHGVLPSIAHTKATYSDVKAANEAGLTVSGVIASVLYGGVIEEVMLRLFFLSLIALILWKGFCRNYDRDHIPTWIFSCANIISAILFAAGHLPATVSVFGGLTPLLLVRCFLMNGGYGLLFGWLYRKYGIVYAMLSHALFHIISKLIWFVFI